MLEKGFDIKVLIPTEDGLTISEKTLVKVPYYLMYNISNRSYQLAGKIKVADILIEGNIKEKLEQLILKEKIDLLISKNKIAGNEIKRRIPKYDDIGEELNILIDLIDQKKELL